MDGGDGVESKEDKPTEDKKYPLRETCAARTKGADEVDAGGSGTVRWLVLARSVSIAGRERRRRKWAMALAVPFWFPSVYV